MDRFFASMDKLFVIEETYQRILNNAIYTIEVGCTLEEFIDLGFNNATLLNPVEEDTDYLDLDNIYIGSDIVDKLTPEMLKVKVVLSSTYEDSDGYTCARIVLENEKDWNLFKDLVPRV